MIAVGREDEGALPATDRPGDASQADEWAVLSVRYSISQWTAPSPEMSPLKVWVPDAWESLIPPSSSSNRSAVPPVSSTVPVASVIRPPAPRSHARYSPLARQPTSSGIVTTAPSPAAPASTVSSIESGCIRS